jgi:hypothetical protein
MSVTHIFYIFITVELVLVLNITETLLDGRLAITNPGAIQGGGHTKYPKNFRASRRSAQFF